ncbi:MAG: adenylosuccinate lyase [Anaerolineales bacterium]|nr:adenylosuccinate lyase [Anaerolineales bacterium]
MSHDYETYLSPFTWRYGSEEMRRAWSEAHKRRLYRQLWLALAEVQAELGLVSRAQVEDLRAHASQVDVKRALEIEAEIHHDLMAEIKAFAEQAPLGGAILHLGATSADIEDNADVLRARQALDLILEKLKELLLLFAGLIETWAAEPLMALTHIQPAEPSTLGYRLAFYAQDLWMDWDDLRRLRAGLRGKGFKGAVGTGASYAELLGVENLARFEARLSGRLELPFFPVSTQVYPRSQDYRVVSALAGLGASLYKFAFDLRLLQSPPLGELSEPFGAKQVGSSAMPFKRNPVNAEKIDSLARLLAGMPRLAWDNAAHSLLERTLDDSANRRSLLPEAFLAADELLRTAIHILKGLQVNRAALARNLSIYGPFAASERVLMALVKAGANRQAMHERLREHALAAWGAVQAGEANPLAGRIAGDPELQRFLPEGELRALLDASRHLGDAPERARAMAEEIRATVSV